MFKIVTPVAAEPITRQEAKLHCRVIADVSDVSAHPEDASFDAWISAAREFAEQYTGRALAPQTLEMALRRFPDLGTDQSIDLDLPPVASVTSIKYTDPAGVEQTLSSGAYALSPYGTARTVALTFGNVWPEIQDAPDAVRIRYVTGYTTTPKVARAAILLLVGHLYEHRQEASSLKVEEIPTGACALLDTITIWSA